jgi:alpha-glutamyl/putrescinyl thymine pyrophosphorylase clade 1
VNENMQSQLQGAPPHIPPSVRPSKVFDTYWRFAAERQEIFFRRIAGAPPPWTADPILGKFKFTCAYRASDRVSQYLIRRVIYAGDQNPEELIFRILVFKMFNRIETWELLEESLGGISLDFLAYQFITDINYSPLTDFSEMEFTVPGPVPEMGSTNVSRALGSSRRVTSSA